MPPPPPKPKTKVIDPKKIWDDVQANWRKLQECVGPHEFFAVEPGGKLGGRFRCKRCFGEIDTVNKIWYESGLKHGRGRT